MSSIAIIPARSGSKRIPHKNIKDFLGKPIISYPINSATESSCFDEVMVSTDSQEIADIAKSCGASVPFLRSPKNSDDHAGTATVVSEALSEYQRLGKTFSYVCCLYPTSVFVTPQMIQQAVEIIQQASVDGVATFTPYDQPIERAFQIVDNHATIRNPKFNHIRTQDLVPSYHDAAQLYFLKVPAFLNENTMFPQNCGSIIIPSTQVQDIDTAEDWALAELKYKNIRR